MTKQQSSSRKQHPLNFKAFVEQCYVPKKQTKKNVLEEDAKLDALVALLMNKHCSMRRQ